MKKTIHHLIPRSRAREVGINPSDKRNLIRIRDDYHRAWHLLFENMTPEEVVLFIVDYFFPDFSFYGSRIKNPIIFLLFKSRREGR